ncbi:MAG TPA: hypothetical protein VH590_20370, partial [Ktedonobacterales bacterium]
MLDTTTQQQVKLAEAASSRGCCPGCRADAALIVLLISQGKNSQGKTRPALAVVHPQASSRVVVSSVPGSLRFV